MKTAPINDDGFTNIAFDCEEARGSGTRGSGARGSESRVSWARGSGSDRDLRHSDPDFHRSVSQTSFSLQEPGETEKADRYRVRPKSGRKQKPQRSMTYRVWKCIALIVMLAILLTGAILVMLRFRYTKDRANQGPTTLLQQIVNSTGTTISVLDFRLNSTTTVSTHTSATPES